MSLGQASFSRLFSSCQGERREVDFHTAGPFDSIMFPVAMALLAVVFLFACSNESDRNGEEPDRVQLLVFAAASLADALDEIKETYEQQQDATLNFSYAGSQTLAQQIASGAPADVFISAGASQAAFLQERDILEGAATDLLTNKLVVITRASDGISIQDLSDLVGATIKRLAIADPAIAPAGRYSQEALTNLGLWESLQPKIVTGQDVRATMAYVESGNADAAMVYATDAAVAGGVVVANVVPQDTYTPVVYPAMIVRSSGHKDAARGFVEYLQGPEATAVFEKYGFTPAGE